jgi:hypothetical protein
VLHRLNSAAPPAGRAAEKVRLKTAFPNWVSFGADLGPAYSLLPGNRTHNGSVAKFCWPRNNGRNASGAGHVRFQVASI